jgi:CheY-like chemotaxis protein
MRWFLRRLKADPHTNSIPVILLTTLTGEKVRQSA